MVVGGYRVFEFQCMYFIFTALLNLDQLHWRLLAAVDSTGLGNPRSEMRKPEGNFKGKAKTLNKLNS